MRVNLSTDSSIMPVSSDPKVSFFLHEAFFSKELILLVLNRCVSVNNLVKFAYHQCLVV